MGVFVSNGDLPQETRDILLAQKPAPTISTPEPVQKPGFFKQVLQSPITPVVVAAAVGFGSWVFETDQVQAARDVQFDKARTWVDAHASNDSVNVIKDKMMINENMTMVTRRRISVVEAKQSIIEERNKPFTSQEKEDVQFFTLTGAVLTFLAGGAAHLLFVDKKRKSTFVNR